jgi:dipeptidyl aminopeptidase/acylaminoacyl peptidase
LGWRRTRVAALAAVALLWASAAGAVGLVDPALRFRQRRTPHFVIYFHAREEPLAARLAALVEEVRDQVGAALGIQPPALTHVILADQAELANGWATPLPRNVVFLTAAVPSGSDFIGRTDNWLRLVFTHEYTHIAHLDLSRGWAGLFRGVLGRSPIVFPNVFLPQWQIEGLATWHESALAGAGRLHAGDFRSIERVAGALGRVEPLDRVNGGLVSWPAGHGPYAYGLGFHEYLANRFGPETLGALARTTAGRLPYFGSGGFRRVFGRSLGTLWNDYQNDVERTSNARSTPSSSADERLVRLTTRGQFVAGPRFAPGACPDCRAEVLYSVRNPDTFPELRAIGADGSGDRLLSLRYLGQTLGATRNRVVFDQQEIRRNIGVYSDLYVLDRASGRVRPLTREQRLIDPDLAPDGAIVAVRQAGDRRELVTIRADALGRAEEAVGADDVEVLASFQDEQFNAPRWSPDGRSIVAERRRLGALTDVVIVDVDTREIRAVASDRTARIVTPTWRPEGAAIVAAADFDGGPFDLYEIPLGGGRATRLTHTSGAFWPDVSPDGRTIVFAGYTPGGFDLFTTPYAPRAGDAPRALVPQEPVAPVELPADQGVSGAAYSPLATLPPTSWSPVVTADATQTRVGALVAGADVLGRHAYAADLTWLVDGPDTPRRPSYGTPDWTLAYAYTRWRPTLFASVSRDTSFLRLDVDPLAGRTTVSQRELQVGVSVPVVHARRSAQVLASVVRSESRYLLPGDTRTNPLVAARLAAAGRTARVYGYSISPEDGVLAGGTLELAREALGSRADTDTATVDVRTFTRGLRRHQVVALRAAGGVSRGVPGSRRAFQLGGVRAAPGVIDFRADALGLLRGFPAASFAGTRIASMNAEYRLPLVRAERGVGTFPLLLRWIHAAAFADAGRVWSDARPRDTWKASWGGEISFDFVAGYGLPVTATVGAAWGRDGDRTRGTSVYLRIGRSF